MLDAIRAEYTRPAGQRSIGGVLGNILLWLVLLPFWLVGWAVGFIWRCIVWIGAALAAGFKAGAGDALRGREQ